MLRDLLATTYERYGALDTKNLTAGHELIDGLRAEEFDGATINEAIRAVTSMEAAAAAVKAVAADSGDLGDLVAGM